MLLKMNTYLFDACPETEDLVWSELWLISLEWLLWLCVVN